MKPWIIILCVSLATTVGYRTGHYMGRQEGMAIFAKAIAEEQWQDFWVCQMTRHVSERECDHLLPRRVK